MTGPGQGCKNLIKIIIIIININLIYSEYHNQVGSGGRHLRVMMTFLFCTYSKLFGFKQQKLSPKFRIRKKKKKFIRNTDTTDI